MKKKLKFYDTRKLYKNGSFIIGKRNLYGIWNTWMYKLFLVNKRLSK